MSDTPPLRPRRERPPRPWLEAALLAVAAATPLLPGWWAPPVLAGVLAATAGLAARRPGGRRERWLRRLLGAAACVALALAALAPPPAPLAERWARWRYAALWSELDRAAESAAAALTEALGGGRAGDRRAFEGLTALTRGRSERLSYLLLDPGAEVVAWAGQGVLHDPPADGLPASGRAFRASFSAATLMAVRPLGDGPRPWRVVAARSLSTDRLPFAAFAPRRHWALWSEPREAPEGLTAVELAGAPTLVFESVGAGGQAGRGARRTAWGLLGLVAAALVMAPGARWVDQRGPRLLVAGVALGALTAAAVVPAMALSALLAAAAVATLGASGAPGAERAPDAAGPGRARPAARPAGEPPTTPQRWRPSWPLLPMVSGAAAVLVPAALGLAAQRAAGPAELGAGLLAEPGVLALRLSLFALCFGLLGAIGRRLAPAERAWEERTERDRPAAAGGAWVAALVALLAVAALHDHPLAAAALLTLGGGLAGRWAALGYRPARPLATGGLALLALAASAAGWESAYREALRRQLEERVLPALSPPVLAELEILGDEVEVFLAGSDLAALTLFDPTTLDPQDLAYELWHHSPLARQGLLSALAVAPGDAPLSTFSFGVPMAETGAPDWSPARWREPLAEVWRDAVVDGEAALALAGESWGRARFWLLPRPGFRLAGEPLEQFAAGLLRGGPAPGRPPEPLVAPALYALYGEDGMVVTGPWRETPPLSAAVLATGRGRVATPAGEAEVFAATGSDGIRALFLPRLAPLEALERVGVHALSVPLVLAMVLLAAALPWLRRPLLERSLRRFVRSYPRRLALVYSLLLLMPLLVLNLVVLRVLVERLEGQQLTAGEAALDSAERVLGEYVLSLEPGFGIDAALDDELLSWLSGVVHHEVNLYWRGSVYASSKPELFTAGLLPKRIPGEIYAGLSFRGHQLSSRVNRAAGSEYLELYSPLRVPGVPPEQARLFLSIPLLAQQEEVAAEVAALRRRALLGSTLLVLLLAAVGSRFARSFTRPLMDIVRGTQRIAAGETSLALAPADAELATLVQAIDRMAERIAEGRRQLLREKRVVERVVENITSGVVSLDRERRVLMHNRVAAELLGVAAGEPLTAALERGGHELEPVAEFLAAADGQPVQTTVALAEPGGGEREWTLVWVPLPGPGEPSRLLVVEDVTQVLRGQRLAAWAEMARIIAHEIKNPLTPIRLSAEHMREVYRGRPEHFDRVFESCTENILRQVGELQQISSEFSTYSRIPRMETVEGDLAVAIGEVVAGYRTAPPKGIAIEFSARPERVTAVFDRKLLGRAVRNLMENALRATAEGGRVRVGVEAVDGRATITVADDGPGVAPELLGRIFDPYFSTHDAGTGLGLPIARRIAEEHGGSITARNRPGGGLEVVITLAAAGAGA